MFGWFKKKETPEVTAPPPAPVSEPEATPIVEAEPEAASVERDVIDPIENIKVNDEPGLDDFVPPNGMVAGEPSHIPGFNYSPVNQDEEFRAMGGAPLPEGSAIADEETIIEALQTVYDPEIPVNIYDLGLIYDLNIADNGNIKIDMSLTAPGCPVAGEMPGMVARAVEGVEGTGEIEVLLVWEPQWTPERMSEDAKLALGMA